MLLGNTLLVEFAVVKKKKQCTTEGKVHFTLEKMTKENTGLKV